MGGGLPHKSSLVAISILGSAAVTGLALGLGLAAYFRIARWLHR